MRAVFQKVVDERLKTFNAEKIDDFVDAYLKEIQNTKDKTSSFFREVGSKLYQ
jgi:non-homologous end joining protein Ku